MDGVVVVLGVGRIDGDERQVAPVLAMSALGRRAALRRLGERLGPERLGNVMGAEGDQADRLLAVDRAQTFAHPGDGQRRAAPRARRSTLTRSPSRASPRSSSATTNSRPRQLLVDRLERVRRRSARSRSTPSSACAARDRSLTTRPRIGGSLGPASRSGATRTSARSPTPRQRLAGPRLARRETRMRGGGAEASSSHSTGVAISSPSRSRRRCRRARRRQGAGLRAGLAAALDRAVRLQFFRSRFSTILSSPLMPKARAISRLPILPAWPDLRIASFSRARNARMSSREGVGVGRGALCCFFVNSVSVWRGA